MYSGSLAARRVLRVEANLLWEFGTRASLVRVDGLGWMLPPRLQRRRFRTQWSLSIGFSIFGPPGPFSFPDSRDLNEVLGDFLRREREGGVPRGSPRTLGDPPWGLSHLATHYVALLFSPLSEKRPWGPRGPPRRARGTPGKLVRGPDWTYVDLIVLECY